MPDVLNPVTENYFKCGDCKTMFTQDKFTLLVVQQCCPNCGAALDDFKRCKIQIVWSS